MAANVKKKKKYRGKVVGTCACACIIAAFLWGIGFDGIGFGGGGGGFFGGGDGNGNGNGGQYTAPPSGNDTDESDNNGTQNQDNETSGDENGNGAQYAAILLIRVVEDSIYHGDEPITMDQLPGILQEHPGQVWELRGERAIMATYEAVRLVLQENDVEYRQTEG